MNKDSAGMPPLETRLSRLLYFGTWLASGAIALGLALALVQKGYRAPGLPVTFALRVATAGIGGLILLPALRVAFMFVFFFRDRDYRLAAAAALVLAIIFTAVLIGLHTTARIGG